MDGHTVSILWWWVATVCTGATIAAVAMHLLRDFFKIWIEETEPPRRFYVVYDKLMLSCEYIAGSKERLLALLKRGKPSPAERQET